MYIDIQFLHIDVRIFTYTYTYILERLYSCGHWHPSCIAHAAHVVRLCGTPYAYSQTLPIWIEIVWSLSGQSTGQGSNEAPQPTDCHTTAAMTDIVVAPKWDLAHTIKSNMVDLCMQRQCVTVAIPTLSPCIKHVYILYAEDVHSHIIIYTCTIWIL